MFVLVGRNATFRLISIVSVLLTLSACSGERRVDQGLEEQILHFGNGTEVQGLDPHIVTGVPEHHVVSALFEGLVAKDPYTLEPIPAIAERWEISEDGKTYRFFLNPKAKWSNGDPIIAEHIHWSWQRAMNPALGNQYVYMMYAIKNSEDYANGKLTDFSEVGVRVIDSLTLEVELNNPTPYFLQLLDHYSTFPVHPDTIMKHGKPESRYTRWTRPGNIVSSGPFVLEDWIFNKVIITKKNPYYWDADNVKLNGINFYPTENITTEERLFRAGQLHWTNDLPLDKLDSYRKNNPEVLRVDPWLGTYFYRFNTRNKPLDDVRVRKALAMSINREQLINTVLKGLFTPAWYITPPGTLGYYADKTFEYDPEKARQLLIEAGYPNGEGIPKLELIFNTHEQHHKIAVAIQEMWKKELNVNVSLFNQDWKVYLDNETQGNFTISRAAWIGDYVDPNNFLDMWLCDGGNNRTGWCNPRYDEMITQLAPAATTKAERFAIFKEAERLLMEDMPFTPLYTYSTKHLKHPTVHGMPPNLMDYHNWKYIYLEDKSGKTDAESAH